jgi:hypothetical protein
MRGARAGDRRLTIPANPGIVIQVTSPGVGGRYSPPSGGVVGMADGERAGVTGTESLREYRAERHIATAHHMGATGPRTGHDEGPIPLNRSGGDDQNRRGHHVELQHDAHPAKGARQKKSRIARLKDALRGFIKVSLKISIRITIYISITITGVGIAANNNYIGNLWSRIGASHYVPGFVTDAVDFAHDSSRSVATLAAAWLRQHAEQSRTIQNPPPAPDLLAKLAGTWETRWEDQVGRMTVHRNGTFYIAGQTRDGFQEYEGVIRFSNEHTLTFKVSHAQFTVGRDIIPMVGVSCIVTFWSGGTDLLTFQTKHEEGKLCGSLVTWHRVR